MHILHRSLTVMHTVMHKGRLATHGLSNTTFAGVDSELLANEFPHDGRVFSSIRQ
jgi:hypothetical protein